MFAIVRTSDLALFIFSSFLPSDLSEEAEFSRRMQGPSLVASCIVKFIPVRLF